MATASTDTPSIRERLERIRPAVLEVAQRYGASNLRVFGSVALTGLIRKRQCGLEPVPLQLSFEFGFSEDDHSGM